jgi:predicted nucleotide-binding protein (sugar kinase/HSP70/actin superfamily)
MKHHNQLLLLFTTLSLVILFSFTSGANDYIADYIEEELNEFSPPEQEPQESDIDYSNNLSKIGIDDQFE